MPEPMLAMRLNRYMVLVIGTETETNKSRRNAIKRRKGVSKANMMILVLLRTPKIKVLKVVEKNERGLNRVCTAHYMFSRGQKAPVGLVSIELEWNNDALCCFRS